MARHHQWLAEGYSPTCLGVVGSVVHDGRKYVVFHTVCPSPLLIDLSVDRLALETPDQRNNLIKLVLPYVVMSFKVCIFFFYLLSVCGLISYSILRSSLRTIISFSHSRMSGITMISSHWKLLTANTPFSLHAMIP